MPDRIAALIEYLGGWPSLAGVPIFGPKLPSRQISSMPSACISLAAMGGFRDLQGGGLYHQRVELRAYGATSTLADALHEKCIVALDAIDNAFHKDVTISDAEMESGGLDDEESNQTGTSSNGPTWPLVTSTWGITSLFEGD